MCRQCGARLVFSKVFFCSFFAFVFVFFVFLCGVVLVASRTTYGDWMRPIAGGLRNIGKPLTIALFVLGFFALVVSMVQAFAGITIGVVGVLTIAVLAQRDRDHRNIVDRASERQSYASAVRSARALYRSGLLSDVELGQARLPGVLSQVSLVEASDGLGRRFTLVHHAHTGEYVLVLECQPQGVALADDEVEDSYVASWAGVMEMLAAEIGVTQMAVTVETSPDNGVRVRQALQRRLVQDAPELAARAMSQIMQLYASGGARTSVLVALTFRYRDARRGAPLSAHEAARRIGQLLPDIREQLAAAGGGSVRTLDADALTRLVRVAYDPASQTTLDEAHADSNGDDSSVALSWENAGPVAAEAGWNWYRHDSGLSRTWQMVDPPHSNVTSSTLARLLVPLDDCEHKRVTVLFRMLPPDKTAFTAEQNRKKASGQAGQEKHSTVAAARAMSQADRQAVAVTHGAVLVFFGLLVTATVSAGDKEQDRLELAARAVESAAGAAKIDLRPCYGAQDVGFAASLPLGFNAASYKPTGFNPLT